MCCSSTRVRLLTLPCTTCTGWQWMAYISGQWSRLRTAWVTGPRGLWSVTQSPARVKLSVMYSRSWYWGKCCLASSLMAWMLGHCPPSKFPYGTKQRSSSYTTWLCLCSEGWARLGIWAEWDFKVQQGNCRILHHGWNNTGGLTSWETALQRSSLMYWLATICVQPSVMYCHGKGGRQPPGLC